MQLRARAVCGGLSRFQLVRLSLKSHRWCHYAASHHVWFFTPCTLGRLAEAARFGLIHWEMPMLPRGGAVGSLGACEPGRLPLEAAPSDEMSEGLRAEHPRRFSQACLTPERPKTSTRPKRASVASRRNTRWSTGLSVPPARRTLTRSRSSVSCAPVSTSPRPSRGGVGC